MRIAVPQFPGSNCDQDAIWALRDDLGVQAEYVWHDATSLSGFDGVFVPGGFTYGDYLRCGAIASRSHIMEAVVEFAKACGPVIGVCNGFQILCETGLLPGALLPNIGQKFLCQDVYLRAENRTSPWTRISLPQPLPHQSQALDEGGERVLRIPIAHGEGRYLADPETIAMLKAEDRIAFTYCGPNGETETDAESAINPNGSMERIAGILNKVGNVLGMMPHPERATKAILGSTDGLAILKGFLGLGSGARSETALTQRA